jgi:hypothetical protein
MTTWAVPAIACAVRPMGRAGRVDRAAAGQRVLAKAAVVIDIDRVNLPEHAVPAHPYMGRIAPC